ncbi:SH3 domain-containing protein [Breoghania corrubedonensis]|uniref:SH3 domain-containing protein n=1 Tax=Breoghania corrubedonensis TaxID=665038 RepID=A0A2T5VGH0_9HYPH|nr:NlpC/P60 family protein [Breoghania corrubedonensis]PTW62840.1 SH3 domain-containing protein [Breoghania corrubedonensis]
MTPPDRRITPWRTDLAAARLRGVHAAERYVDGEPARIVRTIVAMRPEPSPARSLDTELLFGETVTVYERREGWAWVQNAADGYVGWIAEDALGSAEPASTHRLAELRSFRYPGAELRAPALDCLSIGSRLTIVGEAVTRGTRYALLADGSAVIARHLVPEGTFAPDWVAVAERFLGTPYLWAGRSSIGLDCSALVQLALAEAGIAAPRDSDMQEHELGTALDISGGLPALARGDLVFWKGHVGIMSDGETLLHSNGHTMTTAKEPIAEAVARIAASEYGAVTAVRRL